MDCSLILASGSEYKRNLLDRLGLAFCSQAADVGEDSLPGESPRTTARRLATSKAKEVAEQYPDTWVIGGDQVVALESTRLTKPASKSAAIRQLHRLSGRTHELVNAIALVGPAGRVWKDVIAFEMVMRELSDSDIRAYVDEDMPLGCAGAYKIESAGIRLFRAMRGDDYTAIIGLPLTRVWNILEVAGYFSSRQSPPHTDEPTT